MTNLHHCVSVEDMEELFGTIGTILSARMVREGVAEAIFMNEEDAHKYCALLTFLFVALIYSLYTFIYILQLYYVNILSLIPLFDRSVEVFNNRQLDGQPMCVSVISKKVPLHPAASLQTSKTETKSVLKAARWDGTFIPLKLLAFDF